MSTFVRVPFSGAEESKSGLGGTKDSKIPIQKTQSFKGNVSRNISSPLGLYHLYIEHI